MKLLIVTPYFYPQTGGLENYAYNIAKGLVNKFKWKVVILTSNHENKTFKKEIIDGLTIYRLPILFKISNTPINPLWYFKIKSIITNEKPDVINAHAPVPFIADITAAVSKNIPFVLTYHAGTMKKGKILFDTLINIYEKLFLAKLFKKANTIICASKFVKNTLVNKYNPNNIVITPAVDTAIFKPSKVKKSNIVLFIGRHANVYPLKGFYYLIDAMKNIPNATLHVVGEKVKITQKNVKFLGIKSVQKLVEEMQKSSMLVLPSIAPMESFGMVLIEAMACKLPVIGTRMGGIPEIINNNKNGLLVPIKNSKALKIAIEKLINDNHLAEKMGKNGFNDVSNHYLWKDKIEETNKILKGAIK